MDGPLLSVPRLRLTRTTVTYADENSATPIAGPSRLYLDDENEEDTQSTPRIPIGHHNVSPRATPPLPADTPAARLRALLAKVPNDSPRNNPPAPSSPSEPDSDYYPPHLNTTNNPHESLKELFSRALRDPGDTPEKSRRRRNSIDLSEVDASPRLDRVKTDRARSKGKRKSLSDEELEKTSRSPQSYSQATTFRGLRQRLAESQFDLDLKDVAPPTDPSSSGVSDEPSHDAGAILRHLNSSSPPLPAISTPVRSLQLPSQIDNGSNLLDQDSEMQHAMKNMDSSAEGDFARPVAFPASKSTPSARSGSPVTKHGSHNFSHHSTRPQSIRQESVTPNQPKISGLSRHHSLGSSPKVGSPAVVGPSASGLSGRGGVASLHHANGAQSPGPSSMLSQSDFNERNHDVQQDKLKEREREWNRPHHALTRSSSNLSLHTSHERTRTISHPTRPSSSHALTMDRLELHRQSLSRNSMRAGSPASSVASSFDLDKDRHADPEVEHARERNWNSPHPKWTPGHSPTPSTTPEHAPKPTHRHSTPEGRRPRLNSMSSSTSSRASSPAGSLSSKGSQEEIIHEVEHERERNWNSAHPKWTKRHSLQHMRSTSPLNSPPLSSGHEPPSHTYSRDRSHSLKSNGSSPLASRPSIARNSVSAGNSLSDVKRSPSPRPKFPASPFHNLSPTTHPNSRSNSPLPTPITPSVRESPGLSSKFGWNFQRSRSPLPPLELDSEDHSVDNKAKPASHIPLPAKTSKTVESGEPHNKSGGEPRKRGHRRSLTEFSEAVGPIPPVINVGTIVIPSEVHPTTEDAIRESDEESPIGDTPLARPAILPSPSSPGGDSSRLQTAMSSPQSQISTPPLSPPKASADPALSLATPPRRSSFSSSKVEFQTPSPPRGMPDLPGPPSSPSDDGYPNVTPSLINGHSTLIKTPKPPGAWVQTPSQSTGSTPPLVRANSVPEDGGDVGGGLVTPPSTLSRANSLPVQTPAPPGAWMGMPSIGSVGRKSILKVRFDVTPSETETVSSADGLGDDQVSLEPIQMIHPSDEGTANGELHQGKQPQTSVGNGHLSPPSPEEPATPTMKPVRIPRTPPSVRMVDAFGIERLELAEDVQGTESVSLAISASESPQEMKSRNRSVRIVDAMGRQIDDSDPPSSTGDNRPTLTQEEAFSRLRETVLSLARDMSDADLSSADGLPLDNPRFKELQDVSDVARDARQKLAQTLQLVQNDLRAKYGPLREGMKKSNGEALPNIIHQSRFSRYHVNTWIFGSVVFLQILFIIFIYRMSHARAREMFLTTYYDPFYPDLHMHIAKPDAFRHSMTAASSPPWSVYNVPEAFQRAGFGGVYSEFWGNVSLVVSDWQRRTWEAWGERGRTSVAAWPPT